MNRDERMTIGVLAAAAAAERSSGGYHLYDASHIQLLRFVRRARELGLPLDAIRELLRLPGGRSRFRTAMGRTPTGISARCAPSG